VLLILLGALPWLLPVHPASEEEYRPERHIWPQEPVTISEVKSLRDAGDGFNPDEPVLGVIVGEESRAYPLGMLSCEPRRKVVNDTLGGQAIVVTWCDACQGGIVYSREVGDRTLTLAVAGQLWKDSMVLYDCETQTRWSQFSGQAKTGALKGQCLGRLPVVLTTWRTWCRLQPASTVALLPYPSHEYRNEAAEEPERFILGITDGTRAKAWGLDVLIRTPVVNDHWGGRPVLAVRDPVSGTTRLYERSLASSIHTFRLDGEHLVDQETSSTWEPVTGRALSGPLAGKRLVPLPAFVAYRDVWRKFYSRSE
jgi:hypothetical protein